MLFRSFHDGCEESHDDTERSEDDFVETEHDDGSEVELENTFDCLGSGKLCEIRGILQRD